MKREARRTVLGGLGAHRKFPHIDRDNQICYYRSVFNLLLTTDETAWETDKLMRMMVERFKDGSSML